MVRLLVEVQGRKAAAPMLERLEVEGRRRCSDACACDDHHCAPPSGSLDTVGVRASSSSTASAEEVRARMRWSIDARRRRAALARRPRRRATLVGHAYARAHARAVAVADASPGWCVRCADGDT